MDCLFNSHNSFFAVMYFPPLMSPLHNLRRSQHWYDSGNVARVGVIYHHGSTTLFSIATKFQPKIDIFSIHGSNKKRKCLLPCFLYRCPTSCFLFISANNTFPMNILEVGIMTFLVVIRPHNFFSSHKLPAKRGSTVGAVVEITAPLLSLFRQGLLRGSTKDDEYRRR